MRILAVTNMYPTVTRPTEGTFIEQQVKGLRDLGLKVDVMLVDRSGQGYRAYHGLARRIKDEASRISPDLVHIMYGGVLARAGVTGVCDLPTVVSFCGSDLLGENIAGLLRKLAVAYGVWCSRSAARRADGVVVKSKNLLRALPNGIQHNRVRIIPNGIDTQRFVPMDPRECRNRLRWTEGSFHVLFPSNNGSPVKRLWLAQAAVDSLKGLGITAELHPLQGIRHEDVPLWLNASDCLILTSKHEGSPNIVKEALACNRPVVSVDVGDVVERVDGIKGCFVVEAEPSALGLALKKVFDGPRKIESRTQMAQLSLTNVAVELKNFYHDILNMWPGGLASSIRQSD